MLTSIVYVIYNICTFKVYIGSTKNGLERWDDHKGLLEHETKEHHSFHLQNSWNLYGPDAFEFHILEICTPENRKEREQFWLDLCDSANRAFGYNIKKNAISGGSEPEHSRMMTEYWASLSEEEKERQVRGIIPRWDDPKYRAKMEPISAQKFYDINQRCKIDPEFNALVRSGITEYNSRSDIGEINSAKKKKAWQDPNYRESHSHMMVDLWNTPGFKENHSSKIIDDWNKPGVREERTAKIRARWADPVYREQTIRKRLETIARNKLVNNDIVQTELKDSEIINKQDDKE